MGSIHEAIKLREVIETFNIKNFVETGTGIGVSLSSIIDLNIKDINIYSIEVIDEIYNFVVDKFKMFKNVNLIKGYSHIEIGKILEKLSPLPTLFWNDAHFPGADYRINGATYSSEIDSVKRIPLETELRIIKNSGRDISKDIFVIDDLRVYKDGNYQNGNWDMREICGNNNIDFVYDLFKESHIIVESYRSEGYLILFPMSCYLELCKYLIN
jgi:hypothetical protein